MVATISQERQSVKRMFISEFHMSGSKTAVLKTKDEEPQGKEISKTVFSKVMLVN